MVGNDFEYFGYARLPTFKSVFQKDVLQTLVYERYRRQKTMSKVFEIKEDLAMDAISSHWIQTYSGKKFDLVNPTEDMIDIESIAHALSLINRFIGHTPKPYSVAAHSLLVCDLLTDNDKLAGLLHDASEAYMGDVSSPLKKLLPSYKAMESKTQSVIGKKFNVFTVENKAVSIADLQALLFEKTLLMKIEPEPWEIFAGVEMPVVTAKRMEIIRADHREAEQRFLLMFERLKR